MVYQLECWVTKRNNDWGPGFQLCEGGGHTDGSLERGTQDSWGTQTARRGQGRLAGAKEAQEGLKLE